MAGTGEVQIKTVERERDIVDAYGSAPSIPSDACAARHRRYQCRDLIARYLRDRSPAANAARSLPALIAIDRGERHVDAAGLYATRPAISWILARSGTRHSMPSSARDPAGQSA